MLPKRFLIACLCLAALPATARQGLYPQTYFRDPLNIPIVLAGNFGECRPGHFHSGIDIKTQGRENLPVFAAADGYISRIKMEPGGFGHALYITHANGYTTLYAHLNDFVPELQRFVRQQQYQHENWELDMTLKPAQFPVKKGQQIAWSGNTGGSTAPHLHFEIRDTRTEHPLNPLLFGLKMVDTRAPLPQQLALYDLSRSIYEQSPLLKPLKKKGAFYVPPTDTLDAPGTFTGLGIQADDYMNGSDNTLAFYTAEWSLDNELYGRIRLDDIGYDETRYLHAYADYKTHWRTGNWIQCLFRLPGNRLATIYEDLRYDSPGGHKGILMQQEGGIHEVRIRLKDASGNESIIRFWLRFLNRDKASLDCAPRFAANQVNRADDHPNVRFSLDEGALYDDICFSFEESPAPDAFSSRFGIHVPEVPEHRYFDLLIRPSRPVPFELRNKIALVCSDGKQEDGQAAAGDGKGWYKASVRSFGTYRLVADTEGPVLKPVTVIGADMSKATKIVFTAKDKISSVQTLRGALDGRWILFEQHGSLWTYRMDAHCPPGAHELVLRAVDENGNTTEQRYRFRR